MVYRRGSNLNPADTKISCVFNNVIQNYLCFTKKCIFFDFSKSHTYLTMIASLVAQVGRLPLGRTRNLVGEDFINLQVVGENPCPPRKLLTWVLRLWKNMLTQTTNSLFCMNWEIKCNWGSVDTTSPSVDSLGGQGTKS